MTSEQLIKLGRKAALISFLSGTGIFGFYFFTSESALLFLGYGFIILTALINISTLGFILYYAVIDKIHRKQLLLTSGLMLLNIPVMLLYCWIAAILLGTVRITFKNVTSVPVTDINIVGYAPKHIDKLETGDSKTVWIGITGDGTVYINYLSNGERKEENVAGYLSKGMGGKITHKIGVKNDLEY